MGKRVGGRKAGTPNRIGRDLREMTLRALAEEGGVEYLRRQARRSPRAFLALLGRILPIQAQVAVATINRPNSLEQILAGSLERIPPPAAPPSPPPEPPDEPSPAIIDPVHPVSWLPVDSGRGG